MDTTAEHRAAAKDLDLAAAPAAQLGQPETARVIVEVVAGIIPGRPEAAFTRRWSISSSEWVAPSPKPDRQMELLAELGGKAAGYAMLLQLQPDRLNWVRIEWIYL